ncbi:MAG: hypothetical protein PVH62_01365 [Anaerolineae bacterium]|jgi:hypothetical protein
MRISKRTAFFAATAVVGGIVIGIAAGTDLSPVLAGLLGAVLISLSMAVLNAVWGEPKFGE